MSKNIFEAANACREAILDIKPTVSVVCTSRVYHCTKEWYVQAHAKIGHQDYVIAFMWPEDNEPTIMHLETFAAFCEYLENMYDIEV